MAKLLDTNSLLAIKDYVDNGLSGKMPNTTIDNSPTQNSNNLVKSGGVYDAISGAISGVYRFQGTQTTTWLNTNLSGAAVTESMNGYVYNVSNSGNLTGGTETIAVSAGDNVAIVWNSSGNNWKWDKLAAAVDLSNYYTKTEVDSGFTAKNAAITGATKCKITYDSKGLVTSGENLIASDIPDLSSTYVTTTAIQSTRFTAGVLFGTDAKIAQNSNAIDFYPTDQGSTVKFTTSTIEPTVSGIGLGTNANKFTDLYLSGELKDGTNSITVAQMKTAYDAISGGTISGAVYTTGDQDISGTKTITNSNGIRVAEGSSKTTQLQIWSSAATQGTGSAYYRDAALSFVDGTNKTDAIKLRNNGGTSSAVGSSTIVTINGQLIPGVTSTSASGNGYNLGTSSLFWQNLFLGGAIYNSDGDNVTVAQLKAASDLASLGVATQQEAAAILQSGVIS